MGTPRTQSDPRDTEYGGLMGSASVPAKKRRGALSASEQARLMRNVGSLDPNKPMSDRVWNGQAPDKSRRELEGEARA